MVQWVVENLQAPWAHYTFVVNPDDAARYDLGGMVHQLAEHTRIVTQEDRRGAADAVLIALAGQDLSKPLLIANCDQWLQWDPTRFWRVAFQQDVDGLIPVFRSAHPKWSYAKLDDKSRVVEMAEKRAISPWATAGLYLWKTAQSFVDCAETMMQDEKKRVNGEWYVAPTFNELIQRGGNVLVYPDIIMWGTGTPEDLEEFKMAICSGRLNEYPR